MLALPGAVYLRQGDEINLLDRDKPPRPLALAETVAEHARTQAYQFGSPLATVRQAVHVRGRECMANAPLARVAGGDPPDVGEQVRLDVRGVAGGGGRGRTRGGVGDVLGGYFSEESSFLFQG